MKDVGTWVKLNAPHTPRGWGNKKDSTNNFNWLIERLPDMTLFRMFLDVRGSSREKYSQTCIKRSPLGQRESGLISYEIYQDKTRKRWPFNTSDYLIMVTTWAGTTVLNKHLILIKISQMHKKFFVHLILLKSYTFLFLKLHCS